MLSSLTLSSSCIISGTAVPEEADPGLSSSSMASADNDKTSNADASRDADSNKEAVAKDKTETGM